MKFALFLVCALVAVQGFQARSVVRSNDGLGEDINTVKDLIKKIDSIVGEIRNKFSEVIRDLYTEQANAGRTFQELLDDVGEKIMEITQSAGEDGPKCISSHLEQLLALFEFQLDNTQDCIHESDSYTSILKENMNVLVAKTNTLGADANERLDYCLNKPLSKPYTQENCLSLLIENAEDQIVELEKEVANTIALAKETVQEAVSLFAVCAAKVNKATAEKAVEYLDSIKECVATSS